MPAFTCSRNISRSNTAKTASMRHGASGRLRCKTRNQVRDGLALARSRGAMDHAALVCHDRGDCPLLAGVGVEDQKFVIGWNQVELFRIGITLLCAHGAL